MTALSSDISPSIAVVIPCYRVRSHILQVLAKIGPEVSRIYVVDDGCPEQSGHFAVESSSDPRLVLIPNQANLGVGGAVMAGYLAGMRDGMDILVKIDGDGQMAPELLPNFARPIIEGWADYAKGNRFYNLAQIGRMPRTRLIGNAILSFLSKASTGYWNIFDPTNGYTAINARLLKHLPLDKISKRYFFETDMLFRLNTLRAVVVDIPMDAQYGKEKSNLRIRQVTVEFLIKHLRNLGKRIFYNYFLRDMTAATFELLLGSGLLIFGVIFGSVQWLQAIHLHTPTPLGTIMLATLPIIAGLQFLLAFLGFDVMNIPSRPISTHLPATHSTLLPDASDE